MAEKNKDAKDGKSKPKRSGRTVNTDTTNTTSGTAGAVVQGQQTQEAALREAKRLAARDRARVEAAKRPDETEGKHFHGEFGPPPEGISHTLDRPGVLAAQRARAETSVAREPLGVSLPFFGQ